MTASRSTVGARTHWREAVFVAMSALALSTTSAHAVSVTGGFEGTSQLDNCAFGLSNCLRPPDTMGAVGTAQFLETSNGSITIYNKATGVVLSRQNFVDFWANAGLPGGAKGDQRVLFDQYTNRWIMSGFGATTNTVNIAVSDTANALGTWKSVQIPVLPLTQVADYPTLSMDNKAVYIGTNNFGGSPETFTGTSLLVIPKADLFGGAPSIANMTQLNTAYPAGADNGFAIQAALNWQGNPTNTTPVIAWGSKSDNLVFYTLNDVNGAGATQTASSTILGTSFTYPGAGRQPDGTRLVDTLGGRISANAVQFDGKIFSVTTVRADAAIGDFAAIRWTIVDATTGLLLSSGKIQQANYDFFEGSIAVNEFGEVVIAYNRSGVAKGDGNGDGLADGNISFLARAYGLVGNALVQEGSEFLLRVSPVSDYRCGIHTAFDAGCRQRWGDYSAVTFDPLDHHTFWAIGEYAAEWAVIPGITSTERAIWHTYISAISFAESAVPEPGSLAILLAGMGALTLTRRRRQ